MNLLELVKARYSCRNYQPTSVEQDKLNYIMECVRLAPSAVNKQPWKFRVITNEADKAKLKEGSHVYHCLYHAQRRVGESRW